MSETEKKDDKKINTRNLFDEFEVDEETRSDINELEKAINKDLYYYVTKV
jgi:DeoR/GlpR family transcriptional regulator of sugar metabolism